MIHTYIVEDERPARERLEQLLAGQDDIEIVGFAAAGMTAAADIDRLQPDLLFLDIHLSDISGIDVLHLIDHQPAVIFTTAYDQYAVQAFEFQAVDYLLKPFSAARLAEALQRVRDQLARPENASRQLRQLLDRWNPASPSLQRIAAKTGDQIFVFADDDVVYFTSEDKVVFACLEEKRHIINYTLDQLEERLDPGKFFRIHRSTIVNLNYVHKIESWFSGGYRMIVRDRDRTELTISRQAGRALRAKLGW